MIQFGKRSSGCKYSVSFFIIVNKIFTVAWCKYNFFWKRFASLRFSIFKKFQVFFHGHLLLSFYMSDVKYNCCTARQMGEKLSDFSNVVIVKGLLVKWFEVNIIFLKEISMAASFRFGMGARATSTPSLIIVGVSSIGRLYRTHC